MMFFSLIFRNKVSLPFSQKKKKKYKNMCAAHKKTPTNMYRIGNALIGRFRFGLD